LRERAKWREQGERADGAGTADEGRLAEAAPGEELVDVRRETDPFVAAVSPPRPADKLAELVAENRMLRQELEAAAEAQSRHRRSEEEAVRRSEALAAEHKRLEGRVEELRKSLAEVLAAAEPGDVTSANQ
jgi:hypothetical protein